jgi:hypothetical protein
MKLAAEISTTDFHDLRHAERCEVAMGAGLRQSGSKKVSVDLMDISTNGFRIEIYGALPEGSRVWLTLPGLESICARVAWRRGDQAGCEFTTPLHPAVLERAIAAAKIN